MWDCTSIIPDYVFYAGSRDSISRILAPLKPNDLFRWVFEPLCDSCILLRDLLRIVSEYCASEVYYAETILDDGVRSLAIAPSGDIIFTSHGDVKNVQILTKMKKITTVPVTDAVVLDSVVLDTARHACYVSDCSARKIFRVSLPQSFFIPAPLCLVW
jgi:hypothetical protein